jgi:hypothetical protein
MHPFPGYKYQSGSKLERFLLPRALDAIEREAFEIRIGFDMRFVQHGDVLTRGNLRSSIGSRHDPRS